MNNGQFDNQRPDILGLAHDMRSPLSVIKGFLETITITEGEEMDFYKAARNSLEKLLGIAERMRWAKDKRKFTMCDIGAFVLAVVEEINFVAREKGITVSYTGPANLVCMICQDEIERVLINLVTNAMDASKPGDEVAVALGVQRGQVIIEVTDYGTGIDPAILPHIFDRGFTHGKAGGTGIGLDVCKKIVVDHGGTIEVKSELNLGTIFAVSIPAVPELQEKTKPLPVITPHSSCTRLCTACAREDTLD